MTSENFLACVSMCFENLLQALHRSDAVFNFVQKYIEREYGNDKTGHDKQDQSSSKVNMDESLSDKVSSIVPEDMVNISPMSSRDEINSKIKSLPRLTLDEQDLILSLNKSCKTSCCELAQRSLSQLLSLRKDANAKVHLISTSSHINLCMHTSIHVSFLILCIFMTIYHTMYSYPLTK